MKVMSEEKKETTTEDVEEVSEEEALSDGGVAEMVKIEDSELKAWEISDYVDSWIAQSGFKAYVYSYSQGGREVTGLSARAYEHLALDPRHPITLLEETEEEVTIGNEKGILTKVKVEMTVIIPEPTVSNPEGKSPGEDGASIDNPVNVEKIIRVGKNFSPFMAYGRLDPFVYQKSSTKAFRNAVAKCIPATKQEEAKQTLLALQDGKPVDVSHQQVPKSRQQNTQRASSTQTQQKSQQKSQTQGKAKSDKDELTRARESMFARYNEVRDHVKAWVDEAEFWNVAKAFFKVESRNEMTVSQFKAMRENLKIKNQDALNDKNQPDENRALFGQLVMQFINEVLKESGVEGE